MGFWDDLYDIGVDFAGIFQRKQQTGILEQTKQIAQDTATAQQLMIQQSALLITQTSEMIKLTKQIRLLTVILIVLALAQITFTAYVIGSGLGR